MTEFIARILVVDDQPASIGLLLAYLQDRDIDLLVAQCNGMVRPAPPKGPMGAQSTR